MHNGERKMQRAPIGWYEDLLERVPELAQGREEVLAAPLRIRSFGPVLEKAVTEEKAKVPRIMGAVIAHRN